MKPRFVVGAATIVAFAACLAARAASPSQNDVSRAELRIETACAGICGPAASAQLQLRDVDDASRPPVNRSVTVPGVERIRLPGGSTWRVSLTGGCCWAPLHTVNVAAASSQMRLVVVPAALIDGRLETPRGEQPPARITLTLLPSVKGGLPAEFGGAEVECPVQDGRWRCRVPAGSLDVRLRAPGFLSDYRWGMRATAGNVLDAGLLRLRRGTSLSGWVRTADGRPLGRSCRVELELPAMTPDESEAAAKSPLRTLTATALENGFFQFEGIGVGTYAAIVRHSAYAAATLYPVIVERGAENVLGEPIVIEPPLDLTVSVNPGQDFRGRPWRLSVISRSPIDGRSSEVPTVPLETPGMFRSERLAPGAYLIRVRDQDHQQLASQEFLLSSGSDTATIEVALLELRGSVFLGQEPLPAATIALESREDGVMLRFQSDAQGEFNGQLPKGQLWRASVHAEMPRVEAALDTIEVSEQETDALVEIRLPASTLRGQVVDESGQGVPALVEYLNLSMAGHAGLNTDALGGFELHGLPHGELALSAVARDGRVSETVNVSLDASGQAASVRLIVRGRTSLSGVVTSAAGPAARALILGSAKLADGSRAILDGAQAVTGADGSFQLDIPARARSVDLVVMPRGRVLDARKIALPAQGPVALELPEVGGTVRLRWRQPIDLRDAGLATPALLLRGVLLDFALLGSWARENGSPFESGTTETVIPGVAAGEYRACFPRPGQKLDEWIAAWRAGSGGRCVDGALSAGGELTLSEP